VRLDALRGLFLVIMAGVHVPTPLSHYFQEPFGYTSAAEGFVFLGACLTGLVYGKTLIQSGWTAMSRRLWMRAGLVYLVHLSLLCLAMLAVWVAGDSLPPLANHFHFFLTHPISSLMLTPLLLHQPPLFDILPLYVFFLAASPWLLRVARKSGWKKILFLSGFGWLLTQSNFTGFNFQNVSLQFLRPGSFNLLAWQFLWICGLALGEISLHRPIISPRSRTTLVVPATLVVAVGLLSRHGLWPQAWLPGDLFLWMDKWTLGPLRALNFISWVIVLMAWNPKISPRLVEPLAMLGRHSLAVFAAHLPLVIIASTTLQMFAFSNGGQTLIGLYVLAIIFLWARWLEVRLKKPRMAPNQSRVPITFSSLPTPAAVQIVPLSGVIPKGAIASPVAFPANFYRL
jgi:hypothetical protein